MKFEMPLNEIIGFEQLRNPLVTAPVLKLFNLKAVTEIHSDESVYGYGAFDSTEDDKAPSNRIHE